VQPTLRMLAFAAALWLAAGAVPAAAAPAIPLAQAHLSAYEATYAISGAATGRETWQIRAGSHGTTDVTLKTSVSGESETDQLVLGARGLGLRSARERLTAPSLAVTITATVSGTSVNEVAVVNGQTEHVHYPMTATSYANEALLPTLAGLRLKSGERSVIHDIILQHAEDAPVGIAVGAATEITTPAGTFHCLAVTLSSAGGRQTAWVATGAQPVLVRYANGQTTFTLTSLTR
jgi:hypothetical protein